MAVCDVPLHSLSELWVWKAWPLTASLTLPSAGIHPASTTFTFCTMSTAQQHVALTYMSCFLCSWCFWSTQLMTQSKLWPWGVTFLESVFEGCNIRMVLVSTRGSCSRDLSLQYDKNVCMNRKLTGGSKREEKKRNIKTSTGHKWKILA